MCLFGAPASTLFRFILLPHGIQLISTRWLFCSLDYRREMKHGNGKITAQQLSLIAIHISKRSQAPRMYKVFLWATRENKTVGIKYLYFIKTLGRVEIFLWCRNYSPKSWALSAPKTVQGLFPNFFCSKHWLKDWVFKYILKSMMLYILNPLCPPRTERHVISLWFGCAKGKGEISSNCMCLRLRWMSQHKMTFINNNISTYFPRLILVYCAYNQVRMNLFFSLLSSFKINSLLGSE